MTPTPSTPARDAVVVPREWQEHFARTGEPPDGVNRALAHALQSPDFHTHVAQWFPARSAWRIMGSPRALAPCEIVEAGYTYIAPLDRRAPSSAASSGGGAVGACVIKGRGFQSNGGGFAEVLVDGRSYAPDQIRAALAAPPAPAGDAAGVLRKALTEIAEHAATGTYDAMLMRQIAYRAIHTRPSPHARAAGEEVFQERVLPWLLACFGQEIASDKMERNHRFFEEAAETVQAAGMTRSEAHQLVDYVFDRPTGELPQEVGGVMVTLAALCLAQGIDMHGAGETELSRIWTKVEKIRAKQAAKPRHSPLPERVTPTPAPSGADGPDSEENRIARIIEDEQDIVAVKALCEAQDRLGMSTAALSRRSGVSVDALNGWRAGASPSLRNLEAALEAVDLVLLKPVPRRIENALQEVAKRVRQG